MKHFLSKNSLFGLLMVALAFFVYQHQTVAANMNNDQEMDVFVVTRPGHAAALTQIYLHWDPGTDTGYDWNSLKRLNTDNRTPDNIMRLTVEYLVEAVQKMTGKTLNVSSRSDVSKGIVLMTYDGAPANLRQDPDIIKALANDGTDAYNANEAFFIRSEPDRLLIIANRVDGLNAAVVELLESVDYEILAMGRNWIHVPDYRRRPLTFSINRAGRPDYYIRGLNPMGGQDRGRGTINAALPHPDDEPVRESTMRWRTGFRLWGASMPPYPGHALDSYHERVLKKMIAMHVTEGFLCSNTTIGLSADRPQADLTNDNHLWIDADDSEKLQVYISNGSKWLPQNPARGIKSNLDLTVPLVREVILKDMISRAKAFFDENHDDLFIFATDPEDGPGYASFAKYARYPDWYPQYRRDQNEPLGQPYSLHGFRRLNQPNEIWDAQSPSNHVFAFNSWLLSEFDKWIDSLPVEQRVTATGRDKKEQIRCSFYSYNYHDVPPEFNPDDRCRVMVAGYPKFRGRGKWVNFGNQLAMASAFKQMLPREPSGDYRIISLADYWDSKIEGLPASWNASPESIATDLGRTYNAGIKSLMLEMDFNFGKNGLGYYLISKLLWDISLTPSQLHDLRDRWLQRAYGSGWVEMKSYYDFMLKDQFPSNTAGTWSRAIRMIDAADKLIDSQAEPDAQRRLDDIKQFWYFYYLLETGQAHDKSAAFKAFLWKGQMSYVTAMEMVIDFFPDVKSRNPAHAAGHFANGPAHYTHEETQQWWDRILEHWQPRQVNEFSDFVLADGTPARDIDLNDAVPVREFQSIENPSRQYQIARRHESSFHTHAEAANVPIGFKLFWPFTPGNHDTRQRAVYYGVDYWDARAKSWQSTVDQTMTESLSQLVVDRDGRKWQLISVKMDAPYAGNYRMNIDPVGDVEARLADHSYELANDRSHAHIPMNFTTTRSPVPGRVKAWFYIPKGAESLDLEFAGSRPHTLTLYKGLADHQALVSREVKLEEPGTMRIALNKLEQGSLASIEPMVGDTIYFPYLYSIPTLWAVSPKALMIPRSIVKSDGLTAME